MCPLNRYISFMLNIHSIWRTMPMKKIEIDTFLKFQFLSNPQFSPDGTKIAFTVSVPDLGSNGYLADLYLYDL